MPRPKIFLAVLLAGTLAWLAHGQEPAQTAPDDQLPSKLVTVSIDKAPLRDALAQLQRQTGMRITLDAGLDNALATLQAQDKPLWPTLQSLLLQASPTDALGWTLADDQRMGDSASTWRLNTRMSVSGPFLVVASRIIHDVDYRRPEPEVDHFNVMLQVVGDPSVHIAGINYMARLEKAVDERGMALEPASRINTQTVINNISVQESFATPLALTLILRPKGEIGGRLQQLQGAIPVMVATRMEKVELPIDASSTRGLGELQVTCTFGEGNPKVEGEVEAKLSVPRPPTWPEDKWSEVRERFQNVRIAVMNPDGSPLPLSGTSASGPANAVLMRSARFTAGRGENAKDVKSLKAVIEFAGETRRVQIPFSFENLPLR